MTPEEKQEMATLFVTTMVDVTGVDPKKHRVHHQYVEDELISRKISRDRREAIIKQVMGWGIIVIISGIGLAVFDFAKTHLNR